jgi:hypothetical protein
MNASTKTTLAAAAMLLLSVSAHAGDDKAKMMDTDGDGAVSAAEHEAGAKLMFDKMDADHDGNVTATEMDAAHASMDKDPTHGNEMSSADKIKTIDSNGDGVLSAEEHSAGSKAMFQKMDTDGNGSVSRQEMDAAKGLMSQK